MKKDMYSWKIYRFLAVAAAMLLGMTSCIYDNVDCPEPMVDEDGPGLSFVISTRATVDGMTNGYNDHYSASGEGFENFIQLTGTKRGMRVLFFTKEGKFRYRMNILTSAVKVVEDGYQIDVSEKMILAADHGPEILRMIKEDGFKIAVLANWPIEQIDEGAGRFEYGDDIGKLSHFNLDSSIDDMFDIYSHVLKPSAGGFLSSCNTSWVRDFTEQHGQTKNRYEDRIKKGYWRFDYGDINAYIKKAEGDNAGGSFTANEKTHTIDFHRHIDDLNEYTIHEVWRLWDFSGGQNDAVYAGSKYAAEMKRWSADFVSNFSTTGRQTTITANTRIPSGDNTEDNTLDGLIVYTGGSTATYVPYNGTAQSGYIQLGAAPTVNTTKDTQAKRIRITDLVGGTPGASSGILANSPGLAFNIPCDVTVRVTASAPTNNTTYLYMTWVDQANTSNDTRQDWWFVSGFKADKTGTNTDSDRVRLTTTPQTFDLTMNPSNQLYFPVFIFGQGGQIRIHNVEFVKDVHLYDIDSVAQLPDEENPIPMFGVQDFDPVGEDYDKTPTGKIFPISTECDWAENYDYKKIYLVRSLAKVEIYFPRSIFEHHKPTNVYMRTMNTRANCETVDVRTPTDLLWFGQNSPVLQGKSYTYQQVKAKYTDYKGFAYIPDGGIDEELRRINNEHIYKNAGSTNADKDGTNYKKRLSWFYGSWRDWKWDWNQNFRDADVPTTTAYPRIFNPRIEGFSNNNYVRFIEVPDQTGDYIKYICYSPEKIPDDTDINGNLTSRAKVEHVELHFGGPQDNMDDNFAYRLYFTDYSRFGGTIGGISRWDFDDQMEKTTSNLQNIDPVLRNHVYRFYVEQFNPDKTLNVQLRVVGPEERTPNITIN